MRRALITLSIGLPEPVRDIHRIFNAYARKYGMAFEVIDQPVFRIFPNWFRKRRVWIHIEKFQLFEAFTRYDRILFLDSDILLNPCCPDIIERVPPGELGCVFDDLGDGAWKRREELQRLERHLGRLPGTGHRYFNSGVMVLDATHQPLFEMDRRAFRRGRWPEQTLLNYRAHAKGCQLHDLGPAYNFFPNGDNDWENAEVRRDAHVIHYASQAAKAQLPRDLVELKQAWQATAFWENAP